MLEDWNNVSFIIFIEVVPNTGTFLYNYVTFKNVDLQENIYIICRTLAPERCVFGIMMDVSAFLGIATVYVRYKQVEALLDDEVKLQRLNCFGLVLGWMSSFGMCVVANFQKTTLFSMHMVGAVLTFGVGALYILVQTLLSHYMQPHIHSKTTFVVRLTILVWTLGSIISSILNFPLPGYVPHMVSTVSEWFLAFSFISFFLTYIRDFQVVVPATDLNLKIYPPLTPCPKTQQQ
uniref:DNA-damage regulated autophagy modulator 2b n=1 Tax=Poecilia reticulata TaxID=8081 RepID=A0A3P9PJ69_POERE